MKKVLLSLAAVTAIAAAASPAAAARNDGANINQRQQNLAQRIDRGFHRGDLTRAEANRLVAQLRQVEAIERHYRRGGLLAWERRDLDRRLDAVQTRMRFERRDRDRQYGAGYGRW
ncbi:MAG TPA: hypothetical protein VD906_13545 [Caulobacteraceae bacterium]|nr:hypothetical protein [Caulobacteraceae bacterium]